MIKLNELTNERILSLGKEQDITICGSNESILWDGDLEELLDSLEISFSNIFYVKNLEYEIGGGLGIINCEEGELVGYALMVQKSQKVLVPIVASSTACSELDEQFDFDNLIEGGK